MLMRPICYVCVVYPLYLLPTHYVYVAYSLCLLEYPLKFCSPHFLRAMKEKAPLVVTRNIAVGAREGTYQVQ